MPTFLIRLGRRTFTPGGIALVYALIGTVWIFFSDRVLPAFGGDSLSVEALTRLQTAKGLAYVGVTATLLYFLVRGMARLQHRSRQALEEVRNRYEQLLERTAAVVLIVDAEACTIVDANPAAVAFYGWSREELAGRDLADLLVGSPDQVRAEHEAARIESRDFVFLRHRTRSRGVREVAVNTTPITTPRRQLEFMLIHDVTELRSLEQQLRQAQKMEAVGQLTGGIAHDLNNVLTVVLASADLIGEDLPAGSGSREDLADLKSAARRGASMIRKLMSFSRSATLTRITVDLGELVSEMRLRLARDLPPNIELRGADTGAGLVRVDTVAMEQIVANLASNAAEAMPEGGILTVETGRTVLEPSQSRPWVRAGSYAFLRVTDTGSGMDERTRSKVFEPFFTTKRPEQGTGLGLAMIYGLVKQHDGYVTVESEVGRGTTVTVFLKPAPGRVVPEEPALAVQPSGHETILLVEDEAALQRAGQRILERLGYRVLAAPNGEAALLVLEAEQGNIDLVITEVIMPRVGGVDLYRQAQQRGYRVRFLFTSGYASGGPAATPLPDAPFLAKPWTFDELAGKVSEVLSRTGPTAAQ